MASSEGFRPADDASRSYSTTDGVDASKWKFWRRRRYIVAALAFFGFFNVFALRVNVSVAITAMTDNNASSANRTLAQEPEFHWSPKLQGLILGAYFYGYITTQVLGGWLAGRVGGNRLFGVGIAVTSFLTFLTPVFARINEYWFIGIRMLEGICQGVSYPSMHDVWAHWAPPLERSRLATFSYSGSYIGTVVAMTVSGVLAQHVGWPSIFYVFGGLGIVWFAVWWLLVQRSPDLDKAIDPNELKYIQESLGSYLAREKEISYPWRKFFLSMPVWAVIVANFCENWGFYTLLTELPTFMKDALGYDLQQAGFLSALPYLIMAIAMQVAGQIADCLLIRDLLTVTQVRKLFCCGAFMAQSLFMLLTAFLVTPTGAVTCLTIAVGVGAFALAGFFVNQLDLAPQYASVLMGIGNTAGTMPGIICPNLTGYLVTHETISEWRIVFYIGSGIYLVGAIFYGIFASGERQSWAKEEDFGENAHINKTQNNIYNKRSKDSEEYIE